MREKTDQGKQGSATPQIYSRCEWAQLQAPEGYPPHGNQYLILVCYAGAMPPPLDSRDDHRARQRGPVRGGATSQWPLRERAALTNDTTIGIVGDL